MHKKKSQISKDSVNIVLKKKQEQGMKSLSNKVVRCPVLTPLERLAADMAWNG